MEVTVNGESVMAFVDTGSTISLVTEETYQGLALPSAPPDKSSETLIMVDGTELTTLGTVTVTLCVGGAESEIRLHRVRNLPAPILLGIDLVHKAHLVLDFCDNCY